MTKKQNKMLVRIIISALLLIVLGLLDGFKCFDKLQTTFEGKFISYIPFKFLLYLIDYLIIGYDILKKAVKGIGHGQLFDENFLMALATLGAFALSIYSANGNLLKIQDCNEAIAVMLFYQIGELFQSVAVGKSRRNISDLMDIRPDYANIEIDGKLQQVDPEEVEIGNIIIVQPGEKVPIDGIVIEGNSTLNTSALTGESLPRQVNQGDEIISGSININGLLKIKTTKAFGESTVSKILELVENASSRKSKSEEFISKFARIYTPAVVYSALALAILPPLVQLIFTHSNGNWSTWIYRALTFLVISCPCALVISIPLSFFAGLGGASKEGILIKGSNYLETLSKSKIVVFDKTGTLTKGVFEVTGIHHSSMEESVLLELAAHAECASSHPISKSIQNAHGKLLNRNRVKNIEELPGFGITAQVDEHTIAAGNSKLMEKLGITPIHCHSIGTIIHIAIDGKYSGHVVISDIIKETSKDAIIQLKKAGVSKTVMLTGDADKVAQKVASDLGIDEVHSELLPADKVDQIEILINQKNKNEVLAFVGDGINDAPVLSRADIGIAMGAMGSDAAIEAADVVLMDDDPLKISKAIKISRKCIGIVYQNIIFALVIKFGCLIFGALGLANMWLAIFADVGVMVLAVLNAIRALNVRKL